MGKLMKIFAWLNADRKRLIGVVVFVLLLVFGIFKQVSANKNKVSYQTTAVTRGIVISSVSASGQILTSNLVNVSTQASGVVRAVYVKDGQKIYAGQKIAEITLDSDGALANAKAWANLVSANNNYRVTQAALANIYDQIKGHDADETFVQKEVRTKAEAANDNAYASLAAANLSYRQTSPIIVAPMTGIVDNITITQGMILSGTNRIAAISSKGNPMATFNVSEIDVSRVRPGQKATITLDSVSGKIFTGKVLTADKIGTVVSGVTNYPVTVLFDTSAPEILPNMAATANIIIESKSGVLLIPSEAAQTANDGRSTVRVLRRGQPEEVTIEIGLSSDTQTEVLSGINEGDLVIVGMKTGTRSSKNTGSTSPFSTFRVGGASPRR